MGGDSVTFIMEHEKFSFPEALRYLANKYHIEIEETQTSTEDKQAQDEKESLMIILSYAAKFLSTPTFRNGRGKPSAYLILKKRGFWIPFRLFSWGMPPDSYDSLLKDAHKKNGYNNALLKTGLIKEKTIKA